MTFDTTKLNDNLDKMVKVAGIMLKAAEDQTATPQDVINVLASVVDQLNSLKEALPGEGTGAPTAGNVPPGTEPAPAGRGAALQKDTAEESKEKVEQQNAAQLALHDKTFKAMQSRIDTLEAEKSQRDRIELAEQVSDLYSNPAQRTAKYNEVINSDKPNEYWETVIEVGSEFTSSQIKPAKTTSTWLPIKTAKQKGQTKIKFI